MHHAEVYFALIFLITGSVYAAAPITFDDAKRDLRQRVYQDQNQDAGGELYCGCDWIWVGRSGGRIDFASCGYVVRAEANRAARIEWEHIVPASVLGSQRLCWQQGGRKNCAATDPVFSAMEADLHNLAPSVGEVNVNRSNYRYGVLPQIQKRDGDCETKVDFKGKGRVAEPRDTVKGMVARVQFYMYDRYDLMLPGTTNRVILVVMRGFSDSKEASAVAAPQAPALTYRQRCIEINEFVLQRKNRSAVLCKSCA